MDLDYHIKNGDKGFMMMKRLIKYLVILILVGGIIGILACKSVNLYIERTYGDVKADALTKNNFFEKNKDLLKNQGEKTDYIYKSNFNLEEINNSDFEKLDINSYAYTKNQITILNSNYEMSEGIKNLFYQTINSYKSYSSFYIIDLENGTSLGYNVDNIYQTASVIKAAYCLYLYKQVSLGMINLDEEIPYTYNYYNDGTGLVKDSPVGTMYTVRDLIKYTVVNSDNIAYKMLHGHFGVSGYNAMLDELGINKLHLSLYNPWGLTDLRSMAIIWQEIYHFATESSWGEEYLNLLSNNVFNYFKDTIPDISSATKEGFTKDVTISSGILFGYHPIIVLASAKTSYDDSSYRQVKRILPIINMVINEYTKYLVVENNSD